jgi:imidazoleglycerol-phosphate dehydratase
MGEARVAAVERSTGETSVKLLLGIDGTGVSSISTGVAALDHFLTLFSRHGQFDLNVEARGDLEIDAHHTVEDIGICLGQAIRKALGDHKGIRRTADVANPMDEALAHLAIDCGGRGYFLQRDPFLDGAVGPLDTDLVRHFFEQVAFEARINLHIITLYGSNVHHQIEAVFKAFGRALDAATQIDARLEGRLPSTKEHIEQA